MSKNKIVGRNVYMFDPKRKLNSIWNLHRSEDRFCAYLAEDNNYISHDHLEFLFTNGIYDIPPELTFYTEELLEQGKVQEIIKILQMQLEDKLCKTLLKSVVNGKCMRVDQKEPNTNIFWIWKYNRIELCDMDSDSIILTYYKSLENQSWRSFQILASTKDVDVGVRSDEIMIAEYTDDRHQVRIPANQRPGYRASFETGEYIMELDQRFITFTKRIKKD